MVQTHPHRQKSGDLLDTGRVNTAMHCSFTENHRNTAVALFKRRSFFYLTGFIGFMENMVEPHTGNWRMNWKMSGSVKKIILVFLLGMMVTVNTGHVETEASETVRIGVSVYNIKDAEVNMFRTYLEDYLGTAFETEVLYSASISDTEGEIAFIQAMHEKGAGGVISYLTTDITEVLKECHKYGMYYIRGSGTIREEEFNSVKDDELFLGVIGPSEEGEKEAGYKMAEYFSRELGEGGSCLILTGGASVGNEMHAFRTEGMLNALCDAWGLELEEDPGELARTDTLLELDTGNEDLRITLLPGYVRLEETQEAVRDILAAHPYQAVLGTLSLDYVMNDILEAEGKGQENILVGTVDSFTEQNLDWFRQKDAFGRPVLDYVTGKSASLAGPAFAAMYNACRGDAGILRPEGEAFSLEQSFWTATGLGEYTRLYDLSMSVYENAVSAISLMKVIKAYNPDAGFEDFKALTEDSGSIVKLAAGT